MVALSLLNGSQQVPTSSRHAGTGWGYPTKMQNG
jgi:hypothetical protein